MKSLLAELNMRYFNSANRLKYTLSIKQFTPLIGANLDINHDLYASGIRKNQDHPYLYGIGGLSV